MENFFGSIHTHVMRRWIVAFSLLLVPCSVRAVGTLEYLVDDADRIEESIESSETESSWDVEDSSGMQGDVLFPVPVSVDQDRRGSGEEVETTVVRIRVDGVPFDLSDVPRDSWFAPYVRSAADAGILSGYRGQDGRPLGLYGPADAVTIEQIAKIAMVAAGTDRSTCGSSLLSTTAIGRWSQEYIRCAEKLQWSVFADGTVDVLRPATRSEVIATMLQAFGVEFAASDEAPFTDVDSSTEFRAAIVRAYGDHVVGGYTDEAGEPTGLFGPHDPVNRAEVAKIVMLAKEIYGN